MVATENVDLKKIQVALRVIQDGVKLKFGRRVSHLSALQIMESLNMICKKLSKEKEIDADTRCILAKTLSEVYYFKHTAVM